MDDFSDFSSDAVNGAVIGRRVTPSTGASFQTTTMPQMRSAAALSPSEQATDNAREGSPANLAELRGEIARQTNPAIKKLLSDHLAKWSGPQAAPAADPFADFSSDSIASAVKGISGSSPPTVKPLVAKAPEATQSTPIASLLQGGASLIDNAWNTAPGLVGSGIYAVKRAFGSDPASAQETANTVSSMATNPLGKAFGIENTSGYKNEASRQALDWVSAHIDKGADWIAANSPIPKADAENMISTLAQGAVPAAGRAVKAAVPVVAGARAALSDLTKPTAAPLPVESRIDPTYTKPRVKMNLDGSVVPVEVPKPSAAVSTGWNADAQYGSVGAAGTTLDSKFSQASPEMRQAYAQAKKQGPIDPTAADRHLEADSLPEPIRLTPGQATQNVHLLSDEQNMRAKTPELADRFNLQNEQIKRNLDTIQETAAPDVYSTGPTASGERVMGAYSVKDAAKSAEISKNYKALEDANGGNFPIDTQAFIANADSLLKNKMKSEFVPSSIAAQLKTFREGAPMNFEQFEAMRTNLANEMRKADRAGDGNGEFASSLVRQALEDVPLPPELAPLKEMADKARGSAKERFDAIAADPAYKAVVNDTASADKFMEKFVINGSKKNIQTMRENLAHDPEAAQHIGHSAINWLKGKAGLVDGNGNFSQAGFNKGVSTIGEKLGDLVGPETEGSLRTLGNVARYTQAQPRGSYVNNSGTFVAGVKGAVAGTLEKSANAAVPFFNLGTTARDKLRQRAEDQATKKTLETGAGLVRLKDFIK